MPATSNQGSLSIRKSLRLARKTIWISKMSELEALMQDHYDLKCVHGESVLTQSGFTLIATIWNEKYFLGEFLRHYRWLGVSRFLFVDDGSTDGSVEFCSEQSDVASSPASNTAMEITFPRASSKQSVMVSSGESKICGRPN